MKLKLILTTAFAIVVALTGCGGASNSTTASVDYGPQPAALVKTDTLLGTGTEAVSGKTITVTYTGWLYNGNAASYHGTQVDSGTYNFVLGASAVIAGWDQGIVGMKVGGKRTLIIPSSLAYGASGYGSVPGNVGLIFDVQLTSVN